MQWFFSLEAWLQALLASLVMYAMTTLGAACVFLSKRPKEGVLTVLLGASAGIMIAASFFSLLLPAIEAEGPLPAYLTVTIGFLLGGAFIVGSDLLLSRTQRSFTAIGDKRTALLYFAVTLHNVPEGMAVGVAFAAGAGLAAGGGGALAGLLLALGIAVQNFPEGMCVAFPMRARGMSPLRSFLFAQGSGAVEVPACVLGALAASAIGSLLPWKNTEKTETKGKKKGRCAIVVGASSGIGRETALRLAARGDTVFNLSRTASVPPVRTITADASEEGAFARAIENVCRETGGLDLLIYCAGYSCLAPVAYAKSEDYRYLFEVNYFGAVECLRAAAPFLRKRGGRAVLVGSMGGEMPIPYDGFYSASKAALAMLARETDMEWRSRGVRVSALLPGGTAKGAMFFNPIKKFRELEEEQKKKGIGDANDGSIHATAEKAWISQSNKMAVLNNANISVITDPALKIPAYCLCKTETEYISAIYREKLREQFPEHTHALIIEDEEEFLEQVRYRFRNKAFAHDIFYQDDFLLDFWNFLKCGQSDIMFYKPNAKKRYYSEMLFEHNSGTREYLRIDDSNFYRTAFRKDIFFSDQKEFRIVLPHEKIIAGKIYEVGAIRSTLVKIDDLVKD